GANQDVDRDRQTATGLGDRPRAGGRPANLQVVAKLDSVGSAPARREGRFQVSRADFDGDLDTHPNSAPEDDKPSAPSRRWRRVPLQATIQWSRSGSRASQRTAP